MTPTDRPQPARILALEFDARQAAAIHHVVCDLLGGDLTLVDSVERAVDCLRTGVPDLILLPALVPAAAEAELLACVRALPSAAHIETQITPLLGASKPAEAPQGWRRWTARRTGKAATADGLAPLVFAERLAWSLSLARERQQLVRHPVDRRAHQRFALVELPGLRAARLEAGPMVSIVDVSAGGALVETAVQLEPASETVLQLLGYARQTAIRSRVLRCHVTRLDGQPRYLGAFVFHQPLDLGELRLPAPAAACEAPALLLRLPTPRNAW